MKKLSVLLSLVIASFLFFTTSCGTSSSSSSPGDISKKMFKDIEKGDVDAVIAIFSTKGEEITDEEKEEFTSMTKMLQNEFEKRDGIKSIEIIEEDINKAGDKAEVEFKIIFVNGEEESVAHKYVMEDGKWKFLNK